MICRLVTIVTTIVCCGTPVFGHCFGLISDLSACHNCCNCLLWTVFWTLCWLIVDTFTISRSTINPCIADTGATNSTGHSRATTSSSGSLKELLADVKNNPGQLLRFNDKCFSSHSCPMYSSFSIFRFCSSTGQTKVQLSFRADVLKYEVCTNGTSSHVMYTVNIQAIVCVGTHREIKEWRIQQR